MEPTKELDTDAVFIGQRGVVYALKELSKVGVYSYIDAGHAGWLGWTANLQPAATLFAQIYTQAGSSPFIRGLATNVSNYNALSASTPDRVTQGNPNTDELKYINVRRLAVLCTRLELTLHP